MTTAFSPLPPGSVIGILGGGQLGRMMAIAAAELGYHVHIYCPEEHCPASEVAWQTTTAAYEDQEALEHFAHGVDVLTYEFENIPSAPIMALAHLKPVFPSTGILATSQHRLLEKQAINRLGIATAPFRAVSSRQELRDAVSELGLPAVLKTCRMGYDGKGQALIRTKEELESRWHMLTARHPEQREGSNTSPTDHENDSPFILEGFVRFTMEISVIVARDAHGNIACYCPVQNIHTHHILSETIAPAPIPSALSGQAETIARRIAKGLKLVGLMAVEMFVTEDHQLIVNELAPRPHNSGHWTLDACITSQFEQVIRAVCGLPLGDPNRLCDARMLNLIGDDIAQWEQHLRHPKAKLRLYGKAEARAGRKMGHVTFLVDR